METIGAYEAKTHLSEILDRVSKGETFTITKHGVPVAVLHPPKNKRTGKPSDVIHEIKMFRKNNKLNGLSVKEMIEEGRK